MPGSTGRARRGRGSRPRANEDSLHLGTGCTLFDFDVVFWKVNNARRNDGTGRIRLRAPFPSASLKRSYRRVASAGSDYEVESAKPSFLKLPAEEAPPQVVSNTFPVKAVAPEKRLKLEKSDPLGSLEGAMPPPPPKETPVGGQTSLIKTIQSEVEEKLDRQKQENRDIMDTVTAVVNSYDDK